MLDALGYRMRVVEVVWRDLRYAVRTLSRSPIFTIVAIISLTLGIGANTAMFQLLNALVFRPVPVANPQELVEVNLPERDLEQMRDNHPRWPALTYPLFEGLRERQKAFSVMFAWADDRLNLAPRGEERLLPAVWVSGDYFPALGLTPALGRLFTAAEDRPGCGLPGVVVSHDYWQRALGGDPQAIGRRLTIEAASVEVIGVAPAGFLGLQVGQRFDVALLFCSLPAVRPGSQNLTSGVQWWVTAMGRLEPGWTIERAEAHLRTIAPALFAATLPPGYPPAGVNAYLGATLTAQSASTGRSSLRQRYVTPLTLLLAMTALVLLIACANLTNLMLARGALRRRELSLRLALGASRARLISQLLCESLVLALISVILASILAQTISRSIVWLLSTTRQPIVLEVTPDWRVLAFLATVTLATCLLLGLTPAIRASRGAPGDALQGGERTVAGDRDSLMFRRALVVTQVAISLVLVVGALLFARSFRNLLLEPLGFEPQNVLIVNTAHPLPAPPPERELEIRREVIAALRAIPGVQTVGETFILPLSGNNSTSTVWPEVGGGAQQQQQQQSAPRQVVSFNRVTRGFFDTVGMTLLAGREIRDTDTAESQPVAVVSETFARTIVPGGNPIGRRFWVEASSNSPERLYEIVGLVADAKYRNLRDEPRAVAFVAIDQRGGNGADGVYVVRTNLTVQAVTPAVRDALARVNPNLRYRLRTLDGEISNTLVRDRVMATLALLFGLIASLLAAVGLHGIVSYAVERRRREIAIRLALGASREAIKRSVLRESGLLVGIGLVIGVILSVSVMDAARALLFGLTPRDAGTIALAVAALALIALTASVIPARRAMRVDPMSTLKDN